MASIPAKLTISDERAREIGQELADHYNISVTVGPEVYYELRPLSTNWLNNQSDYSAAAIARETFYKLRLDVQQQDFLHLVEDARDGRRQKQLRYQHPMVRDAWEKYLMAIALTGEHRGPTNL